jgi:hypothetical protein
MRTGRDALREARGHVLERAEKIPDPEVRRGFLEDLRDHARVLELSREWLELEPARCSFRPLVEKK